MQRFLELDSKHFDPAAIDDETRVFNERVEDLLNAAPARWEMSVELERALPYGAGALPPSASVESAYRRTVPGPGGEIPLQVLVPSRQPSGIYLHLHGGGWALGSAFKQDEPLWQVAEGARVAVVSVDYRLAPEHPYPAAVADAEAVAKWLVRDARTEFGADRIVIGGESAGAHLSVLTMLRMRDRYGYAGFAGANLSQGMYDLRLTPGARAWGERRLMLNTPTLRFHVERFLQGADPSDPDVSPFLAPNLGGLPAALFMVGTQDPLFEDSVFMYVRWVSAGNDARLLIFPGALHGFPITPTRLGRDASAAIVDYIRDCVASG